MLLNANILPCRGLDFKINSIFSLPYKLFQIIHVFLDGAAEYLSESRPAPAEFRGGYFFGYVGYDSSPL